MSETPAHVRRQFEIRRKLDAIAPLPDDPDVTVTAAELARHFAVRAQERFTRMLGRQNEAIDGGQMAAMCAEFAAAHALYGLQQLQAAAADGVATTIRDALEDGGEIGGWLYEHLGEETSNQVAKLAGELADLQAEKAAAS